MHTLKVIGAGMLLLGLCLAAGRALHQTSRAALVFLPMWLAATSVNLWYGVHKAGYSVGEEAPVFLLVFAVPALVAVFAWWKLRVA
jgi:hypothetical protein